MIYRRNVNNNIIIINREDNCIGENIYQCFSKWFFTVSKILWICLQFFKYLLNAVFKPVF